MGLCILRSTRLMLHGISFSPNLQASKRATQGAQMESHTSCSAIQQTATQAIQAKPDSNYAYRD